MKRSRSVVLTSLMAGSGLTLAACGDDAPRSQWIDPPAATATVDPDRGQAFTTLEECKAAADFAPADCEQAFAAAQKENEANAPRFAEQQTCEEQFGAGNCVPRQAAGGGGSFFVPLLAGFVMGQVLDDIGDRRYRGRPYYRDRYGYGYVPGYGRLSRDYISGRPRVSGGVLAPPRAQAPARTQSRSAVISRGGFGGGGGRSYGG